MFGTQISPRLNADGLGLEGAELSLAKVIAEETEAQREREFAELPVLDVAELNREITRGFLLQSTWTVQEARRSEIDGIPWDDLLTRGKCHLQAAQRARVTPSELVKFALAKCAPTNWLALFWYSQWFREIVESEDAPSVQASLKMEQLKLSAKGGAARAAKFEEARIAATSAWERESAKWTSRTEFAKAWQEVLKEEPYLVTVRWQHIRDVWLSPARLARHPK